MKDPIHIISLGAGVQSSTMSLMAARGELIPMPSAAIFADTQAEPREVYEWLDQLEKLLPYPVYRVTAGSLESYILRIRQRKDKKGFWCPSGIPHFTINRNGIEGQGFRQCTRDFKIVPLKRKARSLMKEASAKSIVYWIGISLDEAHRMKPSRVKYITHTWPLVEHRITRRQCIKWMKEHGYPQPPKSSCVFCPYHSDAIWVRMKTLYPDEWKRAVEFERAYQAAKRQTVSGKGFEVFLHNQRVNLDEVILKNGEDDPQMDMFGNECEGMCGV